MEVVYRRRCVVRHRGAAHGRAVHTHTRVELSNLPIHFLSRNHLSREVDNTNDGLK